MPSAEYDLRFLQSGIETLESYLLSADLYWPVDARPPAGEPPYPRLTLGGLLLAQTRLHAYHLTDGERARLAQLDEQLDALRGRWRVAWENKALAEIRSRLTLWRNFLEEYRENPENQADRYAYEVGRRVQLHLLSEEAAMPVAENDLLNGLDKLVRAVFQPGSFIWDDELQTVFPQYTYWYLYGRLQGK